MELAINTALLMIGSFLTVNTVQFSRTEQNFVLPSPYTLPSENEIVHRFFATAKEPSLCFVQDHLYVEYCFAFIEGRIVLVGPFRSKKLYLYNLPDAFFKDDAARERYLRVYESYPNLRREKIRSALHTTIFALYGTTGILEPEVSLELDKQVDLTAVYAPEEETVREAIQAIDNSFSLLIQIRSGNYSSALDAYHRIMAQRGTPFVLVNTIEGLSRLRTIADLAMHQAGVPASAANELLKKYKLAGRMVTNTKAAIELSEKMLYGVCKLVRQKHTDQYSPPVAQAIDYIHRHLSEQFGIQEVAQAAGLTPNRFSTKFHEEVGITPSNYITKQRMLQSAQMLAYTNMEIQRICSMVGILDGNYFSRCFKKEFGVSPSAYRRSPFAVSTEGKSETGDKGSTEQRLH